jgi:hypothetical protein
MKKARPIEVVVGEEISTAVMSSTSRSSTKPTVIYQKSKSTWHLPERLLCHHSGFFRKFCNSDCWKEAKEGCLLLRDTDPDVFELFVEWMYTGTYTEQQYDITREPDRSYAKSFTIWREKACLDGWTLGNGLESPGFMNHAMTLIFKIYYEDEQEAPLTPFAVE